MTNLNNIKNKISKLDVFGVLFAAFGVLATLSRLIPNDYWWHVRAGEYIVNNKSIPFVDVFSWYGIENNLYWHSHEWLSEVVIYFFSLIGDNIGPLLFVAISMAILFFLLYSFNKLYVKKNFIAAAIWLLLLIELFGNFSSPRPHMISFNLLAITVFVLYYYRENPSSKTIWFIPFISFLWANFHGGSSNLPYVLAIIFVVTGLYDFEFGRISFDKLTRTQIKTYLSVAVLSVFAIAINPHGIDMILYPYANLGNVSLLAPIAEWGSPDIKYVDQFIYVLPIILSILVFIFSKSKIDLTDLVLIGAFSYLTLQSIRFASLLAIVASFVIFKYLTLDNILEKETIAKLKGIKINTNMRFIFNTTCIVIVVMIVCSTFLYISSGRITNNFTSDILGEEIVDTLNEVQPKRMYNDYNYGGYLIYKGFKPLIDGRADMYANNIYNDFFSFEYSLNDKIVQDLNFDYFVVAKNSTVHRYLDLNGEMYTNLCDDGQTVIYKNLGYIPEELS